MFHLYNTHPKFPNKSLQTIYQYLDGTEIEVNDGVELLDFVDKVFDINIARSPISLKNIKALKELKKTKLQRL